MKGRRMRIARVAGFGLSVAAGVAGAMLLGSHAGAARSVGKESAAETAARAFLASLPADVRRSASFPLDPAERTTWYFIPRERVGVSLLKLDDKQSELLGPLLATALSPEG